MSVISITRPAKLNEDIDSDEEMVDQPIVTPGEMVTDDPVWMKGHGTYHVQDQTFSSVAGNISRVNRLLSVVPLKSKYQGEIGDHVIGRVTEVGNKRWKVDIGSKQDAVLMLGSVNLPGGVLRRKSESDELQMRGFLKEGDLLNAEIQTIFNSGLVSLHTRSLKYGKLRNGVFLTVPLSLVVKSKNHSHDLPGNVSVILGVNGYVWLYKTKAHASNATNNSTLNKIGVGKEYTAGSGSVSITRLEEESSWEIYSDKNDAISKSIRQTITRYHNVIKALAFGQLGITEQRIIMGYEASLAYADVGLLIDKESMESICQDVITTEKMRGA